MPDRHPQLAPDDARILDRVLQSLADRPRHAGPPLRLAPPHEHDHSITADPRQAQVLRLLQLLDHYPVSDAPDDLIARTLERVELSRQRQRFAQQVHALAQRPSLFQWREMLGVAAMILISLSVVWPMLQNSRHQARQIACAENLRQAGLGFSAYAADHAQLLPRHAVAPGTPWFQVAQLDEHGRPSHSNSAHLYLLARARYIHPNTLACPENEYAPAAMSAGLFDWPAARAVSYSYQNQFTDAPLRLDRVNIALLADKNPLFLIQPSGGDPTAAGPGRPDQPAALSAAPPAAPGRIVLTFRVERPLDSFSDFHANVGGHNILTADGRVRFQATSLLPAPTSASASGGDPDNIWLAGQRTDYQGTESPSSENDSFLVP